MAMVSRRRVRRVTEAAPAWLAEAQTGDPAAFDRLVRPLLGGLLALCRRLNGPSADELLQAGWIKAHRGLAGFRGDCSFRAWVVGILYRLATEPERFDPARPLPGQTPLEDGLVPDRLDCDPLAHMSARDLLRRVEEAMERLPVRQRTALHLRAVEGWDYSEIAGVLHTSTGAARMAVLNARRKLRDRMGEVL